MTFAMVFSTWRSTAEYVYKDCVKGIHNKDYFDSFHFAFKQVSKNVAAACVGAKNLHTARPWLQKTGMCLDMQWNDLCVCVPPHFIFNNRHVWLVTVSVLSRHCRGLQHSGGEDHGCWHQCWSWGDRTCAVHRWRYRSCIRTEECAGWRDGGVLLWPEGECVWVLFIWNLPVFSTNWGIWSFFDVSVNKMCTENEYEKQILVRECTFYS